MLPVFQKIHAKKCHDDSTFQLKKNFQSLHFRNARITMLLLGSAIEIRSYAGNCHWKWPGRELISINLACLW